MLCPEVWDFKAPQHSFKVEHGKQRTKDSPAAIQSHFFNHSVSVVLPDTVNLPESLLLSLDEDSDYYRVNDLALGELVRKDFLEAFVKKGELNLLSIENKIDLHNSVAVTPSGRLVLSLLKEDFQKLGLEGKPSFFDRKVQTRFEDSFTPGKKGYERVRECLEKRLKHKFSVILAWEPPEEKLCPSSVAAWFHNRGYTVSLCRQKFIQQSQYSLKVPLVDDSPNIDKLFEWLGIFSIGGDLVNGKEGDYVNTYESPDPSVQVGQVRYLQWTGFFTRKQIERIYKEIVSYVQQRPTLPWCSLHVQGFDDSPVSWGLKEHTFFTDGDNSYTFIFKSNGEYILRSSLSSNNKPRIFQ